MYNDYINHGDADMKIKSARELALALYKGPVSIDSLSKSLSGVVARWEKRKEVVVHSGMVSLA